MHSVLRYSYENGIHFDGITFSSATDYALHPIFGNVPEAEWIEPIEFSVSFDGNVSGDWSASLYKYENGSFSEVPASNLNDVDAEPGKYLLVISISVGRDAGGDHEYYNGFEMAWLNRSIQ